MDSSIITAIVSAVAVIVSATISSLTTIAVQKRQHQKALIKNSSSNLASVPQEPAKKMNYTGRWEGHAEDLCIGDLLYKHDTYKITKLDIIHQEKGTLTAEGILKAEEIAATNTESKPKEQWFRMTGSIPHEHAAFTYWAYNDKNCTDMASYGVMFIGIHSPHHAKGYYLGRGKGPDGIVFGQITLDKANS